MIKRKSFQIVSVPAAAAAATTTTIIININFREHY
jgi:hypothetical protein